MEEPALFTNGQVVNDSFLNQNVRDKIVELQQFNSTVLGSLAKSSVTILPQNTWARIDGMTVTRNLGGNWATGATSSVLRTPVSGWYAFSLSIYWQNQIANTRKLVQLAVNGSTAPGPAIRNSRVDMIAPIAIDQYVNSAGEAYIPANTDISMWAYTNASSNRDVLAADFSLRLISPDVLA